MGDIVKEGGYYDPVVYVYEECGCKDRGELRDRLYEDMVNSVGFDRFDGYVVKVVEDLDRDIGGRLFWLDIVSDSKDGFRNRARVYFNEGEVGLRGHYVDLFIDQERDSGASVTVLMDKGIDLFASWEDCKVWDYHEVSVGLIKNTLLNYFGKK